MNRKEIVEAGLKIFLGYAGINMIILPIGWFIAHIFTFSDKSMGESFQEALLGTFVVSTSLIVMALGVAFLAILGFRIEREQ